MTSAEKKDYHIIDVVLLYLYNSGNYETELLGLILTRQGLHIHKRDEYRLLIKMSTEDLVSFYGVPDDLEVFNYYERVPIRLTDNGIEFIHLNETYTHYQKKQEKKAQVVKKHHKYDRLLKNTTGIVAILATLSTVVLSIISIFGIQEQRSLKQELQQVTSQRDSLKQALSTPQKQLDTLRPKSNPK